MEASETYNNVFVALHYIIIDTQELSDIRQHTVRPSHILIILTVDVAFICFQEESGNELLIGASFAGIFVKHLNGQPTIYFK